MTDNTQELGEILEKVRYAVYYADYHANHTQGHINSIIAEHVAEQKQAILDWHNKLIRTEKLKLLADVRERVVGEEQPDIGDSSHERNILRREEREALAKLEAEL